MQYSSISRNPFKWGQSFNEVLFDYDDLLYYRRNPF